MSTIVVNISFATKRGEPYDVFVGRPSRWGNRWKIGRDGSRDEVIEKYRQWITSSDPVAVRLRELLPTLRGKRLGCYCAPLPCHGAVLAELAEAAP